MGNKTHPIHRRLGVSLVEKANLLPMPHELASVDVDLHGWDSPVPVVSATSKIRNGDDGHETLNQRSVSNLVREGVKLEQTVKMVVNQWLQRFRLRCSRIRIVEEGAYLGVHLWVWDPYKAYKVYQGNGEAVESGKLATCSVRRRLSFRKPLQGSLFLKDRKVKSFVGDLYNQGGKGSGASYVIPLDVMEERLERLLYPNSEKKVRILVYSLNDLVPHRLYKSIRALMSDSVGNRFKTKGLMDEGCQLLALFAYYPVGAIVVEWLKRGLETEKRPKAYMRQLEVFAQYRALLYRGDRIAEGGGRIPLEGFRIEMSGRLGGVDMAGRERVQGGRVPRERLSAGVLLHGDAAETAYGLFGLKLYRHYRELGSF